MNDPAVLPIAKKTIGERLLSPIADVRREEVASALLLTLIMFLVLAAYYMLKTAREVFILAEGGAEVKSYSSAGQALLLLVLVPAYGAFASRVTRIQLVQWVTLFLHRTWRCSGSRCPQAGTSACRSLWLRHLRLMVIAGSGRFAAISTRPNKANACFR